MQVLVEKAVLEFQISNTWKRFIRSACLTRRWPRWPNVYFIFLGNMLLMATYTDDTPFPSTENSFE